MKQIKSNKIKDSRHALTLRVKVNDCHGAVCRDHEKCVIAKAIKRQTGAPWVDVGASVVIIGINGKAKRYILSKDTREQVRYFDENGAFAPCKIKLEPPMSSQALSYRRGRVGGPNRNTTLTNRRRPSR